MCRSVGNFTKPSNTEQHEQKMKTNNAVALVLLVSCVMLLTHVQSAIKQKNSGAWVEVKPTSEDSPGNRFGVASCMADKGQYYLIGGGSAENSQSVTMWNDVWRFDTLKKSWTRIAGNNANNAPTARVLATCAVIGNQLLVFGGYNTTHFFSEVSILDLNANTWSTINMNTPTWPANRFGHSGFVADGKMFVFGGTAIHRLLNDIWAFDPKTRSWEQIDAQADPNAKPLPRVGHASAMQDNKFVIYGGATHVDSAVQNLNDTWVFDLDAKIWKKLNPTAAIAGQLPGDRVYSCYALEGNDLWIYGGTKYPEYAGDKQEIFNDTYVLSLNGYEWSKALNVARVAPSGRYQCSGFFFGFPPSSISIYGGITNVDATRNVVGDMWSFVILQ